MIKYNTKGYKRDLSNKRFGALTVLSYSHTPIVGNPERKGSAHWICKCDCGNIKTISGASLVNKVTTSCGIKGCIYRARAYVKKSNNIREYAINSLYLRYSKSAKYRKHTFTITLPHFRKIIAQPCYYCHQKSIFPIYAHRHQKNILICNLLACGLDRVDSALGYTPDNVVPCCSICNRAKSDLPINTYIDHCKKVAQHWSNRDL